MSKIQSIVSACMMALKENFTEEECLILADSFKFQSLAENEVLLREGERDDALSIIVNGSVMVTRDSGADSFVIIHHLGAGDVAGAMGFIDGNSHSATLRASKPSEVITLHRDKLEALIETYPKLVYKVMRMIIRSVHNTVLRMDQQFVEMSNYISREHGRY